MVSLFQIKENILKMCV